jgi:hypothetical protein
MKPETRWVLRVPCEDCPEGYHHRYAADPWVPWSSRKAVERHLEDLKAHGHNTEGWQVEETSE